MDDERLRQPGNAGDDAVATHQEGQQDLVERLFLADDPARKFLAHMPQPRPELPGQRDVVVALNLCSHSLPIPPRE